MFVTLAGSTKNKKNSRAKSFARPMGRTFKELANVSPD